MENAFLTVHCSEAMLQNKMLQLYLFHTYVRLEN